MTALTVVDSNIQRCAHDKENPYLMLSVAVTRDTRLSVEDLGFLTILLDHPNNFKFNVPYLVKRCNLSKEKTRKLLNKLIEFGYVIANQVRTQGKFLGMIYRVFEKPLSLVSSNKDKPNKQLTCKDINAVEGKSTHGLAESGNSVTNKYDEELSTSKKTIKTNVCMSKGEIKKFKVDVNDQELKNALLIRNCKPITDQVVLDAYVDEFNRKAEEFHHLNDIQRKNNLAIFIKRCIDHNKQNQSQSKKQDDQKQQSDRTIKSIKQAFFFAKQLVNDHEFSSLYSNQGESLTAFECRIRQNLFTEKFFSVYEKHLHRLGLLSK